MLQARVSRWGLEESEARVHGVTGGTVNGRERAAGDRCTHEVARELISIEVSCCLDPVRAGVGSGVHGAGGFGAEWPGNRGGL